VSRPRISLASGIALALLWQLLDTVIEEHGVEGRPVPTGLTTDQVILESLPPVALPLRCRACGQVHKWKPEDAWAGEVPKPFSGDAGTVGAAMERLDGWRDFFRSPNFEPDDLPSQEAARRSVSRGVRSATCTGVMTANVEVFGCRPHDDGATCTGGRRPKTCKGGNRESGRCGGAANVGRALWGFE
jgi:hypothetical protein